MRHEDFQAVAALALFEGMEEDELRELLLAAFLQRFPAGVVLARQGTRADFLHAIILGTVEIFARYGDAEATVAILGAGATALLGAIVNDRPLINSMRTLGPSQILMVPGEPVRRLLTRNVRFALAATRDLAGETRLAVQDLQAHKLRTSLERLANWILRTQRERGGVDSFSLPFQKRTLASLMGTSPENLSRNFQALADHGVQVRGNRFMIADRDKLALLARPAPELDPWPREMDGRLPA